MTFIDNCSCVDFEPPRLLNVRRPKARTPHRCCECRRSIEPGERYESAFGVWDDPGTYKTCLRCVALRDTLSDCYIYSGLFEELSGFYAHASRDEKAAFAHAARARRSEMGLR